MDPGQPSVQTWPRDRWKLVTEPSPFDDCYGPGPDGQPRLLRAAPVADRAAVRRGSTVDLYRLVEDRPFDGEVDVQWVGFRWV